MTGVERWTRDGMTVEVDVTDGLVTITREALALLLVDAGFQMRAVIA